MGKITYCDNILDSNVKYNDYIDNHIKNVKDAYLIASEAFLEIFPKVFNDDKLIDKLTINLHNHDKSKYGTEEFWPYAMKFFPANNINPHSKEVNDDFQLAWLHHVHSNAHHPAYWVIAENDNNKILDMQDIYIIEMLCDWMAMSKYHGSTTLEYWQSESAQKLPMSEYTKSKVNEFMDWMRKNNVHTLW